MRIRTLGVALSDSKLSSSELLELLSSSPGSPSMIFGATLFAGFGSIVTCSGLPRSANCIYSHCFRQPWRIEILVQGHANDRDGLNTARLPMRLRWRTSERISVSNSPV